MRRVIFTEERIGFGGGVITENIRECQMHLNQCTAGLEDLRDCMRTQDWYHDLSDQQSSDEIHQMTDGRPMPRPQASRRRPAAQARVPLRDFEALLEEPDRIWKHREWMKTLFIKESPVLWQNIRDEKSIAKAPV